VCKEWRVEILVVWLGLVYLTMAFAVLMGGE
jgi:hypothetical protein